MDKRQILEKAATPAQEEKKDDDRLMKLAEKFADFVSQKNKPVIEVTDVIIKENHNAVYEERETGLQEGVRSVPFDSGTAQESVGTDNAAEGGQ